MVFRSKEIFKGFPVIKLRQTNNILGKTKVKEIKNESLSQLTAVNL